MLQRLVTIRQDHTPDDIQASSLSSDSPLPQRRWRETKLNSQVQKRVCGWWVSLSFISPCLHRMISLIKIRLGSHQNTHCTFSSLGISALEPFSTTWPQSHSSSDAKLMHTIFTRPWHANMMQNGTSFRNTFYYICQKARLYLVPMECGLREFARVVLWCLKKIVS